MADPCSCEEALQLRAELAAVTRELEVLRDNRRYHAFEVKVRQLRECQAEVSRLRGAIANTPENVDAVAKILWDEIHGDGQWECVVEDEPACAEASRRDARKILAQRRSLAEPTPAVAPACNQIEPTASPSPCPQSGAEAPHRWVGGLAGVVCGVCEVALGDAGADGPCGGGAAPQSGAEVINEVAGHRALAHAAAPPAPPERIAEGPAHRHAGHESGRGYGPGGRLEPMKGDVVEVFTEGAWRFADVNCFYRSAEAFGWNVRVESLPDGGSISGATSVENPPAWRWPHLKPPSPDAGPLQDPPDNTGTSAIGAGPGSAAEPGGGS